MSSFFGTKVHSVFGILTTSCADKSSFSKTAVEQLRRFGLQPGVNHKNGVVMSLHATEAGWMHAGHLVAHAATQHHGPLVADDGPRKWRMGTYDNWKPFQKDNRLTLLLSDQAVALVLTPPRLSHVFNFLDVHLHGQQKILHGSDTQRDMRNPHLREFFKTATGHAR